MAQSSLHGSRRSRGLFLSANVIRSSLNFISSLFVHFLCALAWEEKKWGENLVADVPTQHRDETSAEGHVREMRKNRNDRVRRRHRDELRCKQYGVDDQHADEAQACRQRRVFERRPFWVKGCTECVDHKA